MTGSKVRAEGAGVEVGRTVGKAVGKAAGKLDVAEAWGPGGVADEPLPTELGRPVASSSPRSAADVEGRDCGCPESGPLSSEGWHAVIKVAVVAAATTEVVNRTNRF